jgi:hypothetical protein
LISFLIIQISSVLLYPLPYHHTLSAPCYHTPFGLLTVKGCQFVRRCLIALEVVFHGGNVVGEWIYFPIVAHLNKNLLKNKIRALMGW